MKNIKWLLLFLLCGFTASPQSTITIKGHIINDLEGHDKIYFNYNGEPRDSVRVVNGNFEIVMPFKKGDTPWIYDEYNIKKNGGERAFKYLIEYPGTVTISNIDLRRGMIGTVTGLQSAVDYTEFFYLTESYGNEISKELDKKYPVAPAFPSDGNITPEYDAYNNDIMALYTKYGVIAAEKFIALHPDSYASVFILYTNMGNMNAESIKRNYSLLTKKRQNADEGKEISKYLKGLESSAIKSKIKDFVLLDPNGKKITTKSLRGKYVLLDFWASWCTPCVAEFPNLKEVYKKYSNKNFEILSVSIDKNNEAWLKSLKKHGLPWQQVIDDEKNQAINFAVTAIPAKILIDPNGKIIMRDGDIDKKLLEIFGY